METDSTSPPHQGRAYPSSLKGYHPEHTTRLPFSEHKFKPNFDLLERDLGSDSGAFPNNRELRFRFINSNGAFCPAAIPAHCNFANLCYVLTQLGEDHFKVLTDSLICILGKGFGKFENFSKNHCVQFTKVPSKWVGDDCPDSAGYDPTTTDQLYIADPHKGAVGVGIIFELNSQESVDRFTKCQALVNRVPG